jgi:hypothetical protein
MTENFASRRRFQFDLGTMFGVTLLVAIWAWGTTIVPPMSEVGINGGVYEPNVEWFLFTAFTCIAIWNLIVSAARCRKRAIDSGKPSEPPSATPS